MSVNDARTQLVRCLAVLREKQDAVQRREEIASIVETVLQTLHGDLTAADVRLYRELESLANFIQQAKSEISAIRPEEISDEHIPTATDELDAIVAATEEATGTILDAAEQIETVASEFDSEKSEVLRAAVTNIYEASNFQDITGQRIGKVVKTLKHIEDKIDALVAAFSDEVKRVEKDNGATESKSGTSEDDDLLSGPQLPGEGISQADIDALLAD